MTTQKQIVSKLIKIKICVIIINYKKCIMKLSSSLFYKTTKNFHHWFAKTPIEYSKPLSDLLKVPVIFKCEYLQPSGSVELRGAYALLSALTHPQRLQGIRACCLGNEAIALAYAAHLLNIPCHLYTPSHLANLHKEKIIALGAHLHIAPHPHLHQTQEWAQQDLKQQPMLSLISSPLKIAGNGGSLAMELIKDIPQLKHVILPVRNGDMMAGAAFFLRNNYPGIEVIGCEHIEAPALTLSLKKKKRITSFTPKSLLAQEMSSSLCPLAFQTLSEKPVALSLYHDEEIIDGMRWMLKHHQCLVDASSALTIAACLNGKLPPLDGPTAVVLSGKNVDPLLLTKILASDTHVRY